jgi:pyridoxamine 5'-phosphate oxidase
MPYQPEYTHQQVLNDVWSCLREGVKHGAHPFHTPVLATTNGNEPDLRTVVLRQVAAEQRLLLCHTDVRSPKFSALEKNPQVAWLFYDRRERVQLRLYGQVNLHHSDSIAQTRWEKSSSNSRLCYLTPQAPGAVLPGGDGQIAAVDDGFENFAVISCQIFAIDWLYLRAAGHLRARFDWKENCWDGEWINP